MTSLNCFEEYELANKLLKINKWAGMLFARSVGGKLIAIRMQGLI